MTDRPLLADPHLDQEVRTRGWATLDLLSAHEVEELRAASDRLGHLPTVDRSFAPGFHATIIDGRLDYRRAAHDSIASVVEAPLARHLRDMVLTLTNWLHKQPGAAAVPNHVDWTFVDEPAHRSLSVWVPLRDTDEQTGCIGVVEGSHRAVRFVRAAAHPGYAETDEFGATLPGHRFVPLAAGQAVVFDHRLVHFSAPHHGDWERIAVSCELVPREADVVHFEQIGPGRFRRHVVRPDFFAGYEAGTDPTAVPGHLRVDEVDAPSFDQLHGAGREARPAEPPARQRAGWRSLLGRRFSRA